MRNSILTKKTQIFTRILNFSIEEHVLIDLCISIDLIISFSSFEAIVLLLGVKLLTFILYPLLKFQDIVKDRNATESV